VDNILKEVADALRGVLWEDDRDISDARVLALTAPDDAEEAVEVTVHALGPLR
jgi:Holliday junction resolvase RusA-like endonuclease